MRYLLPLYILLVTSPLVAEMTGKKYTMTYLEKAAWELALRHNSSRPKTIIKAIKPDTIQVEIHVLREPKEVQTRLESFLERKVKEQLADYHINGAKIKIVKK